MLTITEMQEKIRHLIATNKEARALCENEGRDPTPEEIVASNERLDEVESLEEMIATEQRRLDAEARHAEPDPAQVAQQAVALADPNPAPVHRAVVVPGRRDHQSFFPNMGDFFRSVITAGMGERVDKRLYEMAAATRAATGMSEAVGADGGFLVQTDFSTELLRLSFETGLLPSRCRQIPISGSANGIKIPGMDETSRATGSRWGGIRVYPAAEAAEKTKSKPKFRMIELTLNKTIGLCYLTDELMQDASALEAYVRDGFSEEFGFTFDDYIIRGTGVGQPLGILNSGCLVSQAKEAGQAADTIVYENVSNMWARLLPRSQPNSVWLINQNCWPQLHLMSVAVGTGGSAVFVPPGGASESPYATLFGRPVIPIEQCESVGTVGDILLCDFAGYIMATKGGLQSDASIHVRFIYDESVLRFVYRLDGQPMLASAITPYKGGASWTTSHFVALASRD